MENNKHILFVDDEQNFLNSIKRRLRKEQNWVLHFATGVDAAFETIKSNHIDVIVSDIQMPEKTGFDFLNILKSDFSKYSIPVIILTGNAESNLKRKALELGATDLLNKPIGYEDLIARLTNTLKLKSYQDKIEKQNLFLEDEVKKRTLELEFLHQDMVWRLAKAGELRDEETGEHLVRVAHYCKVLAQRYGLDEQHTNIISFTSTLHDLGKIGIPDNILLKKGPLTVEEMEIMKGHCQIGASILQERPKVFPPLNGFHNWEDASMIQKDRDLFKETATTIALTHHEKWDGTGYPNSLIKEEIAIEGRIVCLADVYDALRSKRPYKTAFSEAHTFETILDGQGKHFDPDIVEIFIENRKMFDEIHQEFQ